MNVEEFFVAVETQLAALPGLAGINVVIDQQQNIQSAVDSAIARSSGYAILIGETETRNAQPDGERPVVDLNFGVTIYTPEIVKAGKKTASQLRDIILKNLHGTDYKLMGTTRCGHHIEWVSSRVLEQDRKGGYCYVLQALIFKVKIRY